MDKANDKIYTFDRDREGLHFYRSSCIGKILKCKLCRVVDPDKKVPDLNCGVVDLRKRGAGSEIRWDLPPGDSVDDTVENSSVFSLIRMRWLPSARACGQ